MRAMMRRTRAGFVMVLVWGLASPAVAAPPEAQAAPEPEPAVSIEIDRPAPEPIPPRPAAERDVDEAFWRANIGMQIDLVLDDQSRFEGHLLAVEERQLIAARRSDGTIMVIPASRVVDVASRRPRPAVIEPMREDRGVGLLAGGATMLALGGFMFLGALFTGLECQPDPDDWHDCSRDYIGFLAPAAIMTAAGVPMVVFGKRRQKRFRARQLVAGVALGERGFGLRLGGRF